MGKDKHAENKDKWKIKKNGYRKSAYNKRAQRGGSKMQFASEIQYVLRDLCG